MNPETRAWTDPFPISSVLGVESWEQLSSEQSLAPKASFPSQLNCHVQPRKSESIPPADEGTKVSASFRALGLPAFSSVRTDRRG